MAKVKLHRVSNMSTYAATMSAYAEQYRNGFQSVATHFTSGVQDEEGLAINAFLNKINALQAQIFETYPAAIEACAQVVDTYAEGIQGAGFPEICWTNDEGISSVGTKLTGTGGDEQMGLVEAKRSELAKAMDAAAAATGVASLSGDLMTTKNQAEANFGDSKQTRDSKHQEVSALFDSFISGLDSSHASLSAANALIRQATLVTSISPATVLEAITNGRLTADEMYYLDAIQSSEDVAVIKAVLSPKPEDVQKIMDNDPSKISEGTYVVIADEMTDWSANNDIKRLNYLLKSMDSEEASTVETFSLGVQRASIQLAEGLIVAMDLLYNEKGTGKTKEEILNSDQMMAYQAKLNHLNKIIGLAETVVVLQVGNRSQSIPMSDSAGYQTSQTTDTKVILRIEQSNDANFELIVKEKETITRITKHSDNIYLNDVSTEVNKSEKSLTSQTYDTVKGKNLAYNQDQLAKIEESRQQAKEDLAVNLGKAVGYTALTVVAPGAVPIVAAIDALATDDYGGFGEALGNTLPNTASEIVNTGPYKGMTQGARFIRQLQEYHELMEELNLKEKDTKGNTVDTYLDKGAWTLADDDGKAVGHSSANYYDYNAVLRLREMDNRGAVGFIQYAQGHANYEITASGESAKSIVKQSIDSKTSSEVRQYLLGDSDLSITEMTGNQLNELLEELNRLPVQVKKGSTPSGSEKFLAYLQAEFEYGNLED